jgi:4-diphosphocytidyl-2-C-methyl-D-erythritol kinase
VPEVHRELAHAKLTRSLRVVGLRDDGYHLLEAEMVTLDLADELEIVDLSGAGDGVEPELVVVDEVAWAGSGGAGGGRSAPAEAATVPADASNLVLRALGLVGRRARVRLVKRIPAAAGLGGGSADAAAVLRWAGRADPVAASRLGADVPFCVVGGRAVARGVGEVLEPLVPMPLEVVLVTPAFQVPTPAVYRAWDSLGGPHDVGANDLLPAALEVEPRIGGWISLLAGVAGREPALAGSGATLYFECPDAAAASALGAAVTEAVVSAGERAMVVACAAWSPADPPAAQR